MAKKMMAVFAAVVVAVGVFACAAQPPQETEHQAAPATTDTTAQAPAEGAPAEGTAAPAPTEAPAPAEGAAAEGQPQN